VLGSKKEDPLKDVESRAPNIRACWISSKGIPSQRFLYDSREDSLKVDQGVDEQVPQILRRM